MNDGGWFYICAGAWCFAPVIALVIGIQLGARRLKLPWRIRIEKAEPESNYTAEEE